MKRIGYYNGTTAPLHEMRVPMEDRAVYFGDGIYEGAVSRNGVIYALQEHLERMQRSAREIRLPLPMGAGEMASLLNRLAGQADAPTNLVYWQLSRGAAPRTHAFPPKEVPTSLMVMVNPIEVTDPEKPVACVTALDIRHHRCDIKTLNLLPNVLAMQKAAEAGCHEAVFHREGRVTECTHSNVHILLGGTLITAPADQWILKGTERGHLLKACEDLNIPVREEAYSLDTLFAADEVMITSSADFAVRVDRVDGRPVGGRAPGLHGALRDAVFTRFLRETGG